MSTLVHASFGKRNQRAKAVASPERSVVVEEHAAFFASLRRELEPPAVVGGRVRDSFRAAVLAGIVVSCAFVGLDATGNGNTFRSLFELLPDHPEVKMIIPLVLLMGVMGGGKAAATSLLLAHAALKRGGLTTPLAYMIGGAASAFLFAGTFYLVAGSAPTHGFLLDGLAGGLCAFFYRFFAGVSRPLAEG